MPSTLKVIVALVVFIAVVTAFDHAVEESAKSKQCKQKERAERAMVMCAATPRCVMTLGDLENMVDIYQACTKP